MLASAADLKQKGFQSRSIVQFPAFLQTSWVESCGELTRRCLQPVTSKPRDCDDWYRASDGKVSGQASQFSVNSSHACRVYDTPAETLRPILAGSEEIAEFPWKGPGLHQEQQPIGGVLLRAARFHAAWSLVYFLDWIGVME